MQKILPNKALKPITNFIAKENITEIEPKVNCSYCEECGNTVQKHTCTNKSCTKFENFKSLKTLRNQIVIKLCLFFTILVFINLLQLNLPSRLLAGFCLLGVYISWISSLTDRDSITSFYPKYLNNKSATWGIIIPWTFFYSGFVKLNEVLNVTKSASLNFVFVLFWIANVGWPIALFAFEYIKDPIVTNVTLILLVVASLLHVYLMIALTYNQVKKVNQFLSSN
jgi:hypothetical protein